MTHDGLFVGIDISKAKHDVAIMNPEKKLVCKPFLIRENRAGYQFLVDKLFELQQKHQTQTVYIGMEATADYWKNLYHFLKNQSRAFSLTVINPVQTKAFAKAELRRAKTDPVNAKDIAQYMVEKRPRPSEDRPALFDHIKDLDRQIYTLKKQQTMAINKLHIELGKVAPEIEQNILTLRGQQILALLAHFPTAETIAKASVEELRCIRYGKHLWQLPGAFVTKMKALAQDSIAHKKGLGAGFVVQSLVKSITQYQQDIQIIKEQMKQLYQTINANDSLLATIKGISKETAVVLEAYFGDVHRFPNSKKFVAYFGLNPTVNRSGKKKRDAYMEKKGSGIVRHKLYMAILNIIRRQEGLIYAYYQRLIAAGKPKLVAIGAAMRKLLVIMYAMLKNQTPFDLK